MKNIITELINVEIAIKPKIDITITGGNIVKGSTVDIRGDAIVLNDKTVQYKLNDSFWNKRIKEEGFENVAEIECPAVVEFLSKQKISDFNSDKIKNNDKKENITKEDTI